MTLYFNGCSHTWGDDLADPVDQFQEFIIAWTYIGRFTRYRFDNNYEVNFNPQLKHSLYGNDQSFLQYGKLHYTVWHNELYDFKKWLQNIILLQTLLQRKNKKYIMLNATNNNIVQWTSPWPKFNAAVQHLLCFDQMNDEQLLNEHCEIQSLISQIDQEKFLGWGQWWITQLHTAYAVGPTKHLLEDGHNAIADYILNHDSN